MIRTFLFFLLVSFLLVSCESEKNTKMIDKPSASGSQNKTEVFTLMSTDFSDRGSIPTECASKWVGGRNRPPKLSWNNAPSETGSFTLLMEDETRGKGDNAIKHWSVFNIPASKTKIENINKQPADEVTEGLNYLKEKGYAGPSPPRKHLYTFTIFALNRSMPLIPAGKELTRSQFQREFGDYILDSATISGTYKPSQVRILFKKIKKLISGLLG